MFKRPYCQQQITFLFMILGTPLILILLLANLMTIALVHAQESPPIPLTAAKPWTSGDEDLSNSLAWGDIDGDGDLDLAVGNQPNIGGLGGQNKVYINNEGALSVDNIWVSNDVDFTNSVAWGDVDGDGDLDLAVGNGCDRNSDDPCGANKIYFNKNGVLQKENPWISPEKDNTNSVAWGDLDGDGFLELAIGNDGVNRIYRNVNGVLQKENPITFGDEDVTTTSVAWGDMDGDGFLDLAVGNYASENFVYKNIDGQLETTPSWNSQDIDPTRTVSWGNIDDDPYLELVAGNWGKPIKIYQNENGLLLNNLATPSPQSIDSGLTYSVALGDADGDGDLDLAAGNDDSLIFVYPNENGIFQVDTAWKPGLSTAKFKMKTRMIAWGDVDQDSDLDLAIANHPSREFATLGSNFIYFNQGGPQAIQNNSFALNIWGDINGDGFIDLVSDDELLYHPNGSDQSPLDLPGFASTIHAFADVDNDGDLDIALGYDGANQLFLNQDGLQFTHVWTAEEADITTSLAWGDVDGDGDPDLAVGNDGTNKLYLNQYGLLDRTPIWYSNDSELTDSLVWGDADGDGDLDLGIGSKDSISEIYVNQSGMLMEDAVAGNILTFREGVWKREYQNLIQGEDKYVNTLPTLTISQPMTTAVSPFPLPSELYANNEILLPFSLYDPENESMGYVAGQYSLNSGGQWFPAIPTPDTITTHLATDGRTHIFKWDTFASGFFGQSNNVVFRLLAYNQTPAALTTMTGTFRYPNATPLIIHKPFITAQTFPFRVQGTQVQVFNGAVEPENEASNATVFRMPKDGQTAVFMSSPVTGIPYATNQAGYLNGRGTLNIDDQLLAILPVTQTYRLPPRLILNGENSYAQAINLQNPPSNQLTAELWHYPTGNGGSLLSLGAEISLTYKIVSDTTTVSLSILDDAPLQTTEIPLHDGLAHHLAFSWDGTTGDTVLYADGTAVISGTRATNQTLSATQLRVGDGVTGWIDEIRLWHTTRTAAEINAAMFVPDTTYPTSAQDQATLDPTEDGLTLYWPITGTDQQQLTDWTPQQNHASLINDAYIGFKPLYTVYHSSGPITDDGLQLTSVVTSGVQQLAVSADHPLLLFDLDVSLEWDARNDALFLQQLEDSFQQASAILYDVSNGQVALGQINLFHDKAYWSVADIVVFADNSIRPSAAIGGVVNQATDDPDVQLEDGFGAYLPGQIHMGTSWDPYGENIADLGEEWTRALAHELAHYLLFLPDNYLGFVTEDNVKSLRRVVCSGSFMTTTSDPSFSEFLTQSNWEDDCLKTLANETTARADWETITQFYPMLKEPTAKIDGPPYLPLAITQLTSWAWDTTNLPFAVRNFDIRNTEQERLRLPDGQAYLIKTQNTHLDPQNPTSLDYLEDDVWVALGSPTGGGDRLKVRGAAAGDKVCLIDNSQAQPFSGCIPTINANTVAITTAPIHPDFPTWQPKIIATANNANSVTIEVEQSLLADEVMMVQVYPLHYSSVPSAAPATPMMLENKVWQQTIMLPLPAYEIAVRVWVQDGENGRCQNNTFSCIREAATTFRLNPETWEPTFDFPEQEEATPPQLIGTLLGNPDRSGIGGPDRSGIGGPDRSGIGGPDRSGIGGAGLILLGNPDRSGIGGPDRSGIGGPDRSGIGGAGLILLGNPDRSGIGGPDRSGIGGPDRSGIGGPDRSGIGGGNQSAVGNVRNELNAPILSADAQVVIYNSDGYFADNGVASLQALAVVPEQETYPWLVPVGQAYRVVLENDEWERFISFTYLQREVPEGYEHTLGIYFMAEGTDKWQIIENAAAYPENLIVGQLYAEDGVYQNGVYAVMATIPSPLLTPGWNLLAYPMPDARYAFAAPEDNGSDQCLEQALASLNGRINGLQHIENSANIVAPSIPSADPDQFSKDMLLEPGKVYWVHITAGDPIAAYFAPPERLPDGTFPGCDPLGFNEEPVQNGTAVPPEATATPVPTAIPISPTPPAPQPTHSPILLFAGGFILAALLFGLLYFFGIRRNNG